MEIDKDLFRVRLRIRNLAKLEVTDDISRDSVGPDLGAQHGAAAQTNTRPRESRSRIHEIAWRSCRKHSQRLAAH